MLSFCSQPFGKTQEGEPVDLYSLTNRAGMQLAITNYGGTVVSLSVPDRSGKLEDVVLGYDRLEDYERGRSFFGGTIGRYANRIARGKFTLSGKDHVLSRNEGCNTLHGGLKGFSKRVWAANDVSSSSAQALELTYFSKDGEEGFPGDLSLSVTFSLPADRNELRIEYAAITEGKDTVLNLTNHSYFNLGGAGNGKMLAHHLTLRARHFTPVDDRLIPTGELRNVAGTPFDFTRAMPIGQRIHEDHEQLKFAKGYDHNWVLDHDHPGSLDVAAEVCDPASGRVLVIATTEPGIQFYSANFLEEMTQGKGGKFYGPHSAFCLETQHFADSPNHPEFPSTVLKTGESYRSTTIYGLSFR